MRAIYRRQFNPRARSKFHLRSGRLGRSVKVWCGVPGHSDFGICPIPIRVPPTTPYILCQPYYRNTYSTARLYRLSSTSCITSYLEFANLPIAVTSNRLRSSNQKSRKLTLHHGHPAATLQLASPRRLLYVSSLFNRSRRGAADRLPVDGSWWYVGQVSVSSCVG